MRLVGALPLMVFFCALTLAGATTRTVTNLNDSGSGSLRDTIAASIAGDSIIFADGLASTITLSSGELLLERDLTIIGPGAELLTLKGNGITRIFRITATTANLSGLTITGGIVSGSNNGGGILNVASLVLSRCDLVGNSCSNQGGGLYNVGTVRASYFNASAGMLQSW